MTLFHPTKNTRHAPRTQQSPDRPTRRNALPPLSLLDRNAASALRRHPENPLRRGILSLRGAHPDHPPRQRRHAPRTRRPAYSEKCEESASRQGAIHPLPGNDPTDTPVPGNKDIRPVHSCDPAKRGIRTSPFGKNSYFCSRNNPGTKQNGLVYGSFYPTFGHSSRRRALADLGVRHDAGQSAFFSEIRSA